MVTGNVRPSFWLQMGRGNLSMALDPLKVKQLTMLCMLVAVQIINGWGAISLWVIVAFSVSPGGGPA